MNEHDTDILREDEFEDVSETAYFKDRLTRAKRRKSRFKWKHRKSNTLSILEKVLDKRTADEEKTDAKPTTKKWSNIQKQCKHFVSK